ncbi:hypothetical protein [Winogradskyella sp.]|uniref:hypothetical protein n=1 Tax=Winogradskyella sp. TaxID=1883156 RepID=UPI001B0D27E4|nr:hypothetical protein [Winogradskyella sp.]MBO6879005.1 hypothetical protein [Winogradskyella sp.]
MKNEECLVKIEKKSEIGFWDWQLFSWLSFFMSRGKDLLIITKKRIVYLINNELIKDIEYLDYSKINYNVMTSRIHFIDKEEKERYIGLNDLRVTYEEIQYLKSKLN